MNTTLKEETLGQRLKAARIRKNMTQEELSEIMCIPKSTISAYENDKVDIKGSVIVELAKILNTSPDYLLGMEPMDSNNIINMFNMIKDGQIRAAFIIQLKALALRYS